MKRKQEMEILGHGGTQAEVQKAMGEIDKRIMKTRGNHPDTSVSAAIPPSSPPVGSWLDHSQSHVPPSTRAHIEEEHKRFDASRGSLNPATTASASPPKAAGRLQP
jgi:hypothetical protein